MTTCICVKLYNLQRLCKTIIWYDSPSNLTAVRGAGAVIIPYLTDDQTGFISLRGSQPEMILSPRKCSAMSAGVLGCHTRYGEGREMLLARSEWIETGDAA